MKLDRAVVIENRLSRQAGEHLAKADRTLVEDELRHRPSTDDSGNPLVTTDIVLSGGQARLVLVGLQAALAP